MEINTRTSHDICRYILENCPSFEPTSYAFLSTSTLETNFNSTRGRRCEALFSFLLTNTTTTMKTRKSRGKFSEKTFKFHCLFGSFYFRNRRGNITRRCPSVNPFSSNRDTLSIRFFFSFRVDLCTLLN